ncbi:type I-E CRISPR-associated protein Cse1/CasA [Streptomyces somaliensis]|uniref:type I-E CRISPR-associated protein Cse1/CasA n=1 Tax=Streptomyces somaliensis TaxID=78355 RepID=UPI003F74B034
MPGGTYSLIDEPWIPVRWQPDAQAPDGEDLLARVGLHDVLLRAESIAGLAIAEPPAHTALLRILYALTARVTKLDEAGPGDWLERRVDILGEGRLPARGIEEYFTSYRERFFAHDPVGGRPWMQDARLAEQCDPGKTAGVNKLIVTRPAGNNHAWFRHGSDAVPDLPTMSEAVLNLLVWHYFGPSGRCSSREVNGVKSASAIAGPLRTALSYHPEGDSLFETLLAGLVPPPRTVRRTTDQCPWERDELPDPDEFPKAPAGPCARLTACSQHALLLVPESDGQRVRDAYITWAYRKGRIPRDDDFVIWQISQQNNRYPRPGGREPGTVAGPGRAAAAEAVRQRAARAAEGVPHRVRGVRAAAGEGAGLRPGGPGEGHAVRGRLHPEGVRRRRGAGGAHRAGGGRLRQLGELFGWRLERAVKRAWAAYVTDVKAKPDTWVAEAAARYWPRAEREFWDRFRDLDRTNALPNGGLDVAEARKAFLRLAEEAYEAVTATVTRTQRGAKAVFEARIELYGGNRKKK